MVGTTQMCHDIVGQRVHVAGRINSKNWTEDGKTRQKIHLNSCEIRQLHNDENGDHNNYLNRVQLRAQISSEILNEDNLSRFTLTTARLRSVARLSYQFTREYPHHQLHGKSVKIKLELCPVLVCFLSCFSIFHCNWWMRMF